MSSSSADGRGAPPTGLESAPPTRWPAVLRPLTAPVVVAGRRFPPIGLVLLAALGAMLLVVVATTSWQAGSDELAYWRAAQRLVAGQPLYDPTAAPNTPYAFWYPPPIAQVLAPLTPFLSPEAFTFLWTLVLLGCLWWLGGRDLLVALALIAFLPVAVELRTRNVHLILAVLTVLALRRSWVFWVPATALKIAPVLGGLYLLAAGRFREALGVAVLGGAVLAVSVALAPGAWADFVTIVGGRAGSEGGALIAVPFWARFAIGAALAVLAGWLARPGVGGPFASLGERRGEVLLVVALTLANPTLWATALSLLVAIVPLLRTVRTATPGPPSTASTRPNSSDLQPV